MLLLWFQRVAERSTEPERELTNQVAKALLIQIEDNVAVALEDLPRGSQITVLGGNAGLCVGARQDIPFAHKMAVRPISKGEGIVKYGVPVAYATGDIEAGDWVHTHNAGSSFAIEREAQPR
jgi:hypothetical protein